MIFLDTSKMELVYYLKKVNARITSRFAKQCKIKDLRKTRNFKKVPETLGIYDEYPAPHTKDKFWLLYQKIVKNQL